jgi:hypothetical protein
MESQISNLTAPSARRVAPEVKMAAPETACHSERLWTSLRAQWLGLCRERNVREQDTS